MGAVFVNQRTEHLGSFRSDTAVMTVTGVVLGIVQNVQLQFNQQINRIYDVGNGGRTGVAAVYYVGGRAQGQGTIARVLGPGQSGSLGAFYTKFSSICNPLNLAFQFTGTSCKGGANAGAKTVYSAQGSVITQVGIQVAAQDMIVNENVTFMFANLDVT
jgi:hypothetical protein